MLLKRVRGAEQEIHLHIMKLCWEDRHICLGINFCGPEIRKKYYSDQLHRQPQQTIRQQQQYALISRNVLIRVTVPVKVSFFTFFCHYYGNSAFEGPTPMSSNPSCPGISDAPHVQRTVIYQYEHPFRCHSNVSHYATICLIYRHLLRCQLAFARRFCFISFYLTSMMDGITIQSYYLLLLFVAEAFSFKLTTQK